MNPAAPPLVLLSGMLGDEGTWADVRPGLADMTTTSWLPIDTADTVPELAADVLRRAPSRFAIAGHSLGGIVALEIVRQEPGRVAGLALLNTSARAASAAQLAQWTRYAERVRAGDFCAVAAELGLHTLPIAHRTETLVRRNTTMATTVGATGFLRQLSAQAGRIDLRPQLGAITAPVVVVTGALDEVCPGALQREIVEGIAHADHAVLDASGHMAPLEAPDAVTTLLRNWLSAT